MSNITQEYLVLFRAVTEAEQALETLRDRMIEAQQLADGDLTSRGMRHPDSAPRTGTDPECAVR